LEICRKYLFDNPKEPLTKQLSDRLLRIRSAYVHWSEFPMKGEIEIRNFIIDNNEIDVSTAYRDIEIIKALLGNIKSASKDWHRFRFNAMIDQSYEIAIAKQDPRALAMIIREYAKNNLLHIPDSQNIPWDQIIPQLIQPTEDPTVIGLKRDPNVRQRAKELLDKYTSDIAENTIAVYLEDVNQDEADGSEGE